MISKKILDLVKDRREPPISDHDACEVVVRAIKLRESLLAVKRATNAVKRALKKFESAMEEHDLEIDDHDPIWDLIVPEIESDELLERIKGERDEE